MSGLISAGLARYKASVAANGGSSQMGYRNGRTVQTVIDGFYSVQYYFGAPGNGTDDDTPFILAAVASGLPLDWGNGASYVLTGQIASDAGQIIWRGKRVTVKCRVNADFVVKFGTSSTVKYDHDISGMRFNYESGTAKSCLYTLESLLCNYEKMVFVGFDDYSIDAEKSDGISLSKIRSEGGSIRLRGEMDIATVDHVELTGCKNHPCLELFGGQAITVKNSFFNWSDHEGIVVGYDNVRGEYSRALKIEGNYFERLCKKAGSGVNRPFIHIGKPIDQAGVAYAGTEIVRQVTLQNNYFNADVGNTNLAGVIPALFERSTEAFDINNSIINFTSNNFRVKYPCKRVRTFAINDFTDISTVGAANIQVMRPLYSLVKLQVIDAISVNVTTDASGLGYSTVTAMPTGYLGVLAANLFVECVPEKDCRVFVDTITVGAAAAPDESDTVGFRVQVRGGPVSGSVIVRIVAKVKL